METAYQKTVNSQTGALGPQASAYWPENSTQRNPWDLSAQPLTIGTSSGMYHTSADTNAAPSGIMEGPTSVGVLGSWIPSSMFGGKHKRKHKGSKKVGRKGSKKVSRKVGRKVGRKGSKKVGRKVGRKGSKKVGRKHRFGSCGSCGCQMEQTNLGFGTKI